MRTAPWILAVSLAALPAAAQTPTSPYAGQERREIAALSAEDIAAYLAGEGMGLAKAAELNHYPGPKHVLELSAQLGLSEEQRIRTQAAFDSMHREAVDLGVQIVEKERALDALFRERRATFEEVEAVASELGRLQGLLRAAHLRAHLEMKPILSREQIAKYVELRGYGPGHAREEHRRSHPR
jgi:Spy/CpxP family protein refolding chaperone